MSKIVKWMHREAGSQWTTIDKAPEWVEKCHRELDASYVSIDTPHGKIDYQLTYEEES